MKVRELLDWAVNSLKAADIPDADLEAVFMLGHLLDMNRAQLLLAADREVSVEIHRNFEKFLERRERHEPLAYILGEQEFWSLPFLVSPDVLIPRQDTEILIETTLKSLGEKKFAPANILDLGVGSGAISVVLALEIPEAHVYGVDLSFPALKIAVANALRHNVSGRIHFLNSDWLEGVKLYPFFDIVVSNPPYVDPLTFSNLQPEVVDYEPHLALHGGIKGIEVIGKIMEGLPFVLREGGWFFMEIGADQGDMVFDLFAERAEYDNLAVHKDYAGLPRVFQARKI